MDVFGIVFLHIHAPGRIEALLPKGCEKSYLFEVIYKPYLGNSH